MTDEEHELVELAVMKHLLLTPEVQAAYEAIREHRQIKDEIRVQAAQNRLIDLFNAKGKE